VSNTDNLPALSQIKSGLAKMESEFAKALPGHITPARFVRTAQTAVAMTRNIERLKDQASLYAAVTNAAADGLILDGREAALVIDYNGTASYRPMMRGLLKLAHNSGQIKSLVVELVREADEFIYRPTDAEEPISHKIDLRVARGEVYAVYAMAVMVSGGIVFDVMTVEDINRIRDRSDAYRAFKAGKIKSTPWSTDWSEMARKTVFRRLSKYLPASTDRDSLHSAAERIDDDYTFEAEGDVSGDQVTMGATKKRGAAAAALKDITPKQDDPMDHDPETGEIIEGEVGDPGPQQGDDI
jgi:recombination protein RecT